MIPTQREIRLTLGDWEYCGDILRPTCARLQFHSTSLAEHANESPVTVRFSNPDWAGITFHIHPFILEQAPEPLQTLTTNKNSNGSPFPEATLPMNVSPVTFEVVHKFLYCKEIAMGEVPSLSGLAVLADRYNLDTLFQICLHLLLRRSPMRLIPMYLPLVSIITLPPIFMEYVAIKAGEDIQSLTNDVEWRPRDHLYGADADLAISLADKLFRNPPPDDGSPLNEYDLWEAFAGQGTLLRAMKHAIIFCRANSCSTVLNILSHFEDTFSNAELSKILLELFWRSAECRSIVMSTAACNLSPRVLDIVRRVIEDTSGYNDFRFRWDCPTIPSHVPDRAQRPLTPFIENNLGELGSEPAYQHSVQFGDLTLNLSLYVHECWFPGFTSSCGCALRIHAEAPFGIPTNRVVQICVWLTDYNYKCACLLKESIENTGNRVDMLKDRRLISNFEIQQRDQLTLADFENTGFVFEVMEGEDELRQWMKRHTHKCGLRFQILLKVQNTAT